jgi:hypothetical protein
MECDAKRVHAEAMQQDFLSRTCAPCSRSKQFHHLNWTSEECRILLCLQEMKLWCRR